MPAVAGPDSKAKEQLQKGHIAYNLGHFSEAAGCYEKAYHFVQGPALLANEPEKQYQPTKGICEQPMTRAPTEK